MKLEQFASTSGTSHNPAAGSPVAMAFDMGFELDEMLKQLPHSNNLLQSLEHSESDQSESRMELDLLRDASLGAVLLSSTPSELAPNTFVFAREAYGSLGQVTSDDVHPPATLGSLTTTSNTPTSSALVDGKAKGQGFAATSAPASATARALSPGAQQVASGRPKRAATLAKKASMRCPSPGDESDPGNAMEDDAWLNSMLDGKLGTISHSSVEKARRDRLNNLIEELAKIVPSSDPKYGVEGPGIRRPKHVILADAINLLRKLNGSKMPCGAAPATGALLPPQSATSKPRVSSDGQEAAASQDAGLLEALAAPSLPLPELLAPVLSGVLVEQSAVGGRWLLRISCRDRKGLLADVCSALQGCAVRVHRASITTNLDGQVHDIFEVSPEEQATTVEEIQCAVHAALYSHYLQKQQKRSRAEC